jgi:site-specific DNA-methyltransferase (adenine-specific)
MKDQLYLFPGDDERNEKLSSPANNSTPNSTWCTGLIYGDAIANMKDMNDGSIDLIIADPPISYSDEWLMEAKRVLRPKGSLFMFQYRDGDTSCYRAASNLLRCCGEFVWVFRDMPLSFDRVPICHAKVHWFSKSRAPKTRSPFGSSIMEFSRPDTKFSIVEKPSELMRTIIGGTTDAGDMILDPFMGVGASVMAATKMNRRSVGIECQKKLFVESYNRMYPAKV